jgi:hypothetical protein
MYAILKDGRRNGLIRDILAYLAAIGKWTIGATAVDAIAGE